MRLSLSALALAAALVLPSTAAAIPAGSTQLLDRPSGFGALPFDGVNDSTIGIHALSADGRFVVFTSGSNLLLPGDENTATNVYRLDRSDGTLVQVNTTATGGQPNATSTSRDASISADGRFVEFLSTATNLVAGAPQFGFYAKDLQTGAIELVEQGDRGRRRARDIDSAGRDLRRRTSRRVRRIRAIARRQRGRRDGQDGRLRASARCRHHAHGEPDRDRWRSRRRERLGGA